MRALAAASVEPGIVSRASGRAGAGTTSTARPPARRSAARSAVGAAAFISARKALTKVSANDESMPPAVLATNVSKRVGSSIRDNSDPRHRPVRDRVLIDHRDPEPGLDQRADGRSEACTDRELVGKIPFTKDVGHDPPVGIARVDPDQRMPHDLSCGNRSRARRADVLRGRCSTICPRPAARKSGSGDRTGN